MNDSEPIFHDVDRRPVTATIEVVNGVSVLSLKVLDENGVATPVLRLNGFDVSQLMTACEQYMAGLDRPVPRAHP